MKQTLDLVIAGEVLKEYRTAQRAEWEDAAREQEERRGEILADGDTMGYRHLIVGGFEELKRRHEAILVQKLKPDDLQALSSCVTHETDRFLASISSLQVQAKLTLQRYKDTNKPFHRNDIKDIAFLSTAIPYCDVVVTERSWRDLACRERLDEIFQTEILSDATQLVSH